MTRRIALLAAALAIPVSATSLALTGGAASAAGPKGKTVCSTLSGSTSSGTVTISGCVDVNGANTGGASQPLSIATLAGGGTVTWVSNNTTQFSSPTLTSISAKHCPGYVKGASSEPTADKFSGATGPADTAGFKIPGKYKGKVCIDQSGNITNLGPVKVS